MDANRIYVSKRGKAYEEPASGRVEFIRAETIRGCLGRNYNRLWQMLAQAVRRTPGYSTTGINRLRELVEEGRDNG